MDSLVDNLLNFFRHYVPTQYAYAPHGVCALMSLGALFVLWRGARMIALMTTLVFIGGGLVAGHNAAIQFALPLWPITALGGAIGLALGALLVKLWLAVLLAVCFATISFSVYATKVIGPQYSNFMQRPMMQTEFRVPPADGVAPTTDGPQQFWNYLVEQVPQVQISIAAVLLSGALAGLVIGLALPKTSRAIAAATTGTLTLAAGLYGLAYFFRQAEIVKTWGWYPLAGLGVVWLISLLLNIADQRPARVQKKEVPPEEGDPVTA